MKLAIVGSRSLDGNPDALHVIRDVLDTYQARHTALVIVSGGYLVAEAETPCSQPRPDVSQCDRFLLFGDERGWTLLTLHRITTWREGGPFNVRDTAGCATTYYDLDTLRALHTESVWQALV